MIEEMSEDVIKNTLKTLYRRDLEKLRSEIEAYRDESKIWAVGKNIPNSAGNLCLHLIGNLNTYLGAEIGKTGYVRDRELEFSARGTPRAELLKMIDETIGIVESVLDALTERQFGEEYPAIVFDDKMTTGYFLIHLATHLAYHLGQINYHRRFLDSENG